MVKTQNAPGEVRTHDFLLKRQMHYHCATEAIAFKVYSVITLQQFVLSCQKTQPKCQFNERPCTWYQNRQVGAFNIQKPLIFLVLFFKSHHIFSSLLFESKADTKQLVVAMSVLFITGLITNIWNHQCRKNLSYFL